MPDDKEIEKRILDENKHYAGYLKEHLKKLVAL